jgi:hypothetical protein
MMRTLFLSPPSYQGFDGGVGAPYQARREIRSYWYPTWLAEPAAIVPGSLLVDAAPAGLSYRDAGGQLVHNPDRPVPEDTDRLPFVTPVYQRDLRIEPYAIGPGSCSRR